MAGIFKAATAEDVRARKILSSKTSGTNIKDREIPLLDNKTLLTPREYLQKYVIDLRYILKEPSLYYPGAGGDVDPLKLFVEESDVSTIIYCDYDAGVVRDFFNNINTKLNGYNIKKTRCIDPAFFGCSTWEDFWPCDPAARNGTVDPLHAFGMLSEIYSERSNKRVNFVYLCAEAVQTYKILFSNNKYGPTVVVIQDHGMGGGWTKFGGRESRLYKIAQPALPQLLYVHGNGVWPGYAVVSQDGEPEGMHGFERRLYIRKNSRRGQSQCGGQSPSTFKQHIVKSV